MAVKIPIITVFDSKGLKQAQYQLNKVQGNFRALGRNAAIAGAAIAGLGVALGKAVKNAAEQQKVYAQTEAVLKSTGTTANGTAQDIANLASRLQTLTSVADDQIQSGANLLLTFKNIKNEAGAGNDVFDQTVKAMLDVSRAMGTDASGEAVRLGKALNDPIKGISALTRVGIQFTDQQKAQIKALTDSGDLLGAQKIILAELNSQFGGSAETYAKTFAGQLELMNNELGDLSEEIGVIVMPALRELITSFRELAPEAGEKLKEAIGQVDWKGLAKSVVDLTTFLITHAETIAKVGAALFILNSTFHAAKIAVGLYNAAVVILGNTFTVTAGKIGLATGALKLFRIALITTGIGALVVGLGFIIAAIVETNEASKDGKKSADDYGEAVRKSGTKTTNAAVEMDKARPSINRIEAAYARAAAAAAAYNATAAGQGIDTSSLAGIMRASGPMASVATPPLISGGGGGGGSSAGSVRQDPTGLQAWTANNAKEAKISAKEIQLISKGLSADVARSLVGTNTPIKTANAAIQRINKNGTKAINNLTKSFQNSAAGQQAAAAAASAAAEQAAQAAAAAAQAAAEAAAREAAILAEKQRVYEAFAYSVTSTFARIKDSILGAFSLPELGGSTNSIIRNMDKLLARVRSFSQNITKLSDMGLDPKLLQQVINAGPIAGAKLAANLVSGGVAGLSTINRGFAELGGLAGDIGATGTQAAFRSEQQQTIYNLTVNGGLDSGPSIGKAIVDAIKAYERTSGVVFQGA
jgi:hypothetical protein